MKRAKYRHWTPEEIQFLKDNYPTKGAQFCADYLKREKYLVSLKARSLGIKCLLRIWKKDEEDFMNQYYYRGVDFCCKSLNRTKGSVVSKAGLMGLKVDLMNWQPEELKTLEENYPDYGPTYCTKILKRFKKHHIIRKAENLNLKFLPPYRKVPCPDGHKVCTNCLIAKPFVEFYPCKNNTLDSQCKDCEREISRNYVRANIEKVSIRNKKWRGENQEHMKQYRKSRRANDRIKIRERYKNDPEFRQERIESARKFRRDPKNRETIQKTQRRLTKEYLKDPYFRLQCNLRRNLLPVLAGERKADFTMNLVSCSFENLIIHIEGQFLPGMTKENYGKVWVVDHIIPLNSFDMRLAEDQRKSMHFTNLQPLWATTPIARQHGDFINEGNAEKKDRLLGPTIKYHLYLTQNPVCELSPAEPSLPSSCYKETLDFPQEPLQSPDSSSESPL